jgi:hypothetical protein
MTFDQAWPSYFLSMPCIYVEDVLLGDKGGISNKMSPLNVMGKNETTKIIILSWSKLCNSLDACLVIDIVRIQSTIDCIDGTNVEGSNVG